MATGVSDDLVPHGQTRDLAVGRCRKGADVTCKTVVLPDVGSALFDHFAPLPTDRGNAVDRLTDRLSGERATSDCRSMPVQS